MTIAKRLEQYTLRNPKEVLLVTIDLDGEEDEVVVFKGFSSSLTRPTDPDPDIPVIPDGANILRIDRVLSPHDPANPRYIQRDLSLADMEALL
ncbi:hypothetical protein V0288_21025 [Pannus brasiliensis CCIBt3594]|uniref:DUF7734 domain-containing protein n=1 Tax=Pannus brasiliensis CCIBt3594 TaxID=1427578 RepID=A0AAW9QWM7_9CHRO